MQDERGVFTAIVREANVLNNLLTSRESEEGKDRFEKIRRATATDINLRRRRAQLAVSLLAVTEFGRLLRFESWHMRRIPTKARPCSGLAPPSGALSTGNSDTR